MSKCKGINYFRVNSFDTCGTIDTYIYLHIFSNSYVGNTYKPLGYTDEYTEKVLSCQNLHARESTEINV